MRQTHTSASHLSQHQRHPPSRARLRTWQVRQDNQGCEYLRESRVQQRSVGVTVSAYELYNVAQSRCGRCLGHEVLGGATRKFKGTPPPTCEQLPSPSHSHRLGELTNHWR